MTSITTIADAIERASWNYTTRLDTAQPITDGDTIIGWTFAVPRPGGGSEYGWVLTDGRVSPALEWYRRDAEQYARNTLTY